MKNKIIFSAILLYLILSFTSQTSAQNWFPLEVGNEWQYLVHDYNYYLERDSYFIDTMRVLSDTTIQGNRYFEFSHRPYVYSPIRYDNTSQKIFLWCDTIEKPNMDFTLPDIDTASNLGLFGNCYSDVLKIISDSFNFNDSLRFCKGFTWFLPWLPDYMFRIYFAPGLGLIYYTENGHVSGGIDWTTSYQLIQANLNGINYSEKYFPQISVDPITAIEDSIFRLLVEVSHPYNHIFADGSSDQGLNFIDTVKMHSFYSKGSTIINNPIVYAENISGTENWEFNTTLNMNLVRDNYKFNYRIEAVDKGLVPHISFVPDTGYYVAAYDTTTGVIDIDKTPISFKLYQNYPNPFNPVTTIKYTIAPPTLPQGESSVGTSFMKFLQLKVYDILGNEVATLVNEHKPAGSYEVEFNAKKLTSGIYFYQLKAGAYIDTRKMVLMR